MNIVLINSWYPPQTGFGGIAMYNYYLSRALTRLGHRVTVIASRWSPEVPPYEEVDNVHIHRLLTRHRHWLHRLPAVGSHVRSMNQLLYSARVARLLMGLQRETPVDIVEFAEVGAEGYVYLHLPWRCPVVIRSHTSTAILRRYHEPEEITYSTTWSEVFERYCVRRADLLTAPSMDMAREASESFGVPRNQIHAVPNPIEVNLFEHRERSRANNSQDVLILHVGRLERVKGIEVLAQAIPAVVKQAPRTRFIFIGEDRRDSQGYSWQERLTRFLKKQGVQGKVQFLGSVDQRTLVDWYHRADIAVVPSLNYESFSYTCAQAMAASLPVVASQVGGIPETVDEGVNGVLVEPGNVTELVQAMADLAQDRDLRRQMGEAGCRKARQCFDAVLVAQRMVTVYASATTGETSSAVTSRV